MKTLISCFVLVSIFYMGMMTQAQTAEEANAAYQRGDYDSAIAIYEFLVFVDESNGAQYANLAHAYYQSDEIGKSLLNYLRAKQILPRSTLIAQQIETIKSERIDGHLDQVDWLINSYHLTADYLTTMELSIIVFILWTIFFFVIAVRRKGWGVILSVYAIVVLMSVSLLGIRLYIEMERPLAVVIEDEIQVMSGPDESFLELFSLHEGVDLNVIEVRDDWARFMLADGRQGWVRASSLGYINN